MMLIGDNAELLFLEMEEKYGIKEFLEVRRYRVADSPLTYRQVNALSQILEDVQEGEGKWRKFSFLELVFLEVVKELRRFGFTTEQLGYLRSMFLKPSKNKKVSESLPEAGECAYVAIGCAMRQIQIILTVNADGKAVFYNAPFFSLLSKHNRAFVYVNINEVVSALFKKLGHKFPSEYKTLLELMAERIYELSDKERALIELVRSNSYKTISVHKKNAETWVVRGEKEGDGNGQALNELIRTVEQRDYQDITVQTRGGKVTHYKLQDIIKL
jgi:hypothetical protein